MILALFCRSLFAQDGANAVDRRPATSGLEKHQLPDTFTAVDTSRLLGSPDPLPLESVRVFPGLRFERPTEATHAGDGSDRVFVVEQKGLIRVFKNDEAATEAKTFLDLSDVTLREGNEEGLLGLAFHPRYKETGLFYVYYSTKPRTSVVASFRVSRDDPDKADRASETRLLEIAQPYPNHNGGSMKFGADGMLYIGLGDGGLRDDPHKNAQNLGVLLGKILRIDVDRQDEGRAYAIPKDNPFVGRKLPNGATARGEIWAYGFRNPWRLGVDLKTGELWTGDVGQDRFEEIDLVERGGNYGWSRREGRHNFEPETPAKPDDLIDPLVEYFRGEGQSITGGVVYRGAKLAEYEGAYFYADYLSGNFWMLRLDEHKRVAMQRQVARTELQPAAFGEDESGELLICAFDGGLYRLRPRAIELKTVADSFPRKLSETGLFASVPDNVPAKGLIPYELNVPFWSDFTVKDRYVALPKAASVTFAEKEGWKFPLGTVFVKTFWLHRDRVHLADPIRLETRLLVHAREGWIGYTYVYDDDQREARLIDKGFTKAIFIKVESPVAESETKSVAGSEGKAVQQHYYFPSRSDCLTCHTKQEGFTLGPETAQMNHTISYRGKTANQIELWTKLGLFIEAPKKDPHDLDRFPNWGFGNLDRSGDDDEHAAKRGGSATNRRLKEIFQPPADDESVEKYARAWLDVNCAMCHQPDGIAPGKRDFRFDTPREKMNVVDIAPSQMRRRMPEMKLIAPGRPEHSELFRRINSDYPLQMPPLATNLVDPKGTAVMRRWIELLGKDQRGTE